MLGTGPRDFPTHWKQTILLLLGDGGQALEEDEVGQTTFCKLSSSLRLLAGSLAWSRVRPTPGSILFRLRCVKAIPVICDFFLFIQLLDPATEEHPVPCNCGMAKCALIKALLDKEEEDMEDLEELPPQLV